MFTKYREINFPPIHHWVFRYATDPTNSWRSLENVTVDDRLKDAGAYCSNNVLVNVTGTPIYFYHLSCWGNPPPDYREIEQKESSEIENLKKNYFVIVFGCSRFIV